jgi:hypothetical protein
MWMRDLQRHFPTVVWLSRQVATELSSLVWDFKKAFPPETALTPLEWCLIPLTCVPTGAIGAVLGCGLAAGWPLSGLDLEFAIREGIRPGLLAALPLAVLARKSSRRVLAVLLVGNALLLVSIGIAVWYFVSASAAC